MRTTTAATAALLLLLLGACGEEDRATRGTEEPTATTATPTVTPTATPTATEPTASTTTPPSEGLEKIRVVGEVVQVGDCVVVRDDNATTWTVTGEQSGKLRMGSRVQVTGAPDLTATGCGGPVVLAATITVVDEG
jgi:hypothetical protein